MNLVWNSLDLHCREPKRCPREGEPPQYGWQVGRGCIGDVLLGQNIREMVPLEEESRMLWVGWNSVSTDHLLAGGCGGL